MKVEEFNFDVIVVGGGPAGSSAARMAAKNGCTVALIEKEKEILAKGPVGKFFSKRGQNRIQERFL